MSQLTTSTTRIRSNRPQSRRGPAPLWRAAAAAAVGLALTGAALAQQRPPTRPAGPGPLGDAPPAASTPPASTQPRAGGVMTREEKVAATLKYLETEAYGKKLAAPYWVTRAMGVISMARLPQATATTRLLDVVEKDKHDVVRLLAWQAVLARAAEMDAATHKRWQAATLALAEKGAFRGRLRIALLETLAVAPPNAKAKRIWQAIFAEASAWESQDVPVLDALGRTLAAWKSPVLVDALVKGLTDANACVRAEHVLHAAGCDVPRAYDSLDPSVKDPLAANRKHPSSADLWRKTQGAVAAWFAANKAQWKEVTAVEGEPWKSLAPLYVSAPVLAESVDPADPAWTNDLEIGKADLGQVEAVFVVDATGSMGDVLAWLKRDVARVMLAFAAVSKEPPKLGVVFYRDRDAGSAVTTVLPMTYKLADLGPKLGGMTADGGGDIPEAVLDGLRAGIDGMAWSPAKGPSAGKMVVLVGDAPPKPGTEAECEAIAKKGLAKGIKTFAVKVTTAEGQNDLTTFEAIAKAGGGSTIDATFPRLANIRFVGPDNKEIPLKTMDRPEAQLIVAPAVSETSPGEKIMVHVLSDLISPQYKDRVEPLALTLLANVQPPAEPEKRLAFNADTPPLSKAVFNSQKK